MSYKIDGKDYLNLWKYFEKEASNVKGAMFSTVTWVMGFAAALLAFIFSNLANYSSNAILSIEILVILISFSGLTLCAYAHYTIMESAKHISNNWKYANQCAKNINGLHEIVINNKKDKSKNEKNSCVVLKYVFV